MSSNRLRCPTFMGYPTGMQNCAIVEVAWRSVPFYMCTAHGMTWHKLGPEEKGKRHIAEEGFIKAEQAWRERVS